jgi:fumarate reductase flavoprotein subunit
MQVITTDVAIIGGGGAGLRAAIAIAETDPSLEITLISKVVPMRSHTVAAEGGSAGVITSQDTLDMHFHDTVAGGDWLCDQDTVDYFVAHCTEEMVQLEHWGCPWSRQEDGHTSVRNFGGMSTARTWFAADKTGFHILHTLFQTSMKYPAIRRLDEYFAMELLTDEGRCQGLLAIEVASGNFVRIESRAVVMATGGAGRVFEQNTNAGILTGDGMGMAYRKGAALRDMEFVQYHPTTLPGSGILITEGCRGEGGYLTNKDGYRYLQDYELGPVVDEPTPKTMELGPRDRLSQAFWHEQQKGRTLDTPRGAAVNLELMHLGRKKLRERLPFIMELSKTFLGIDAASEPIPVCPSVHYTMGGIATDSTTATALPGLFACGECSSVGIHGANRLGSNSLAELVVFGKLAGQSAAAFALEQGPGNAGRLGAQAQEARQQALSILQRRQGEERPATLRDDMTRAMSKGIGIYRTARGMQETCDTLDSLVERIGHVQLDDRNRAFNTEWLGTLELGFSLDVARAVAYSALQRRESRGAHVRLDEFSQRDDKQFLKHTMAHHEGNSPPRIDYQDVNITRLPPAERVYGGAAAKPSPAPASAGLEPGHD